jgi:tetratricopeptide (TPR) repeat protein
LNPDLPPKLEDVINKAIEKDRNLRYQNAADIRTDLQRLKRDTDSGRAVVVQSDSYPAMPEAQATRAPGSPQPASAPVIAAASSSSAVAATPISETNVNANAGEAQISAAKGKNSWKIAGAAALVVALLIAGGLYLRSRRSAKLTEKDSVLLADFVNTTGDAVFDGTLKQALAVQLGQSPYLNILPESRIQKALRFMGRPPDDRITRDVAREICLRENVKAMLTGSISSLGSHYVITLEAINAQSGDSIDREQVEAESKEQVLKSLDKGASSLREKLGESIGSVQKFATPLESATTPSLEALQAFSLGQAEHQKTNDEGAIPHLQRAVQLDPNFAMAYATLGVVLNNQVRPTEGIEALKKAYELRDRASEREKFYIQSHYYDTVENDPVKTLGVYREWMQTYPRDTIPRDNTALLYSIIGQPDKAVEAASESLRIDPNDRYGYANLASSYEGLGRFDEAKGVADQAVERKLDSLPIHFVLADLAYIRGDWPAYDHEIDRAKGTSDEALMLMWKGGGLAGMGKLKASRELLEQARTESLSAGAKDFAADLFAMEASDDQLAGFEGESREKTEKALGLSQGAPVLSFAAEELALVGDVAKAESMINDAKKKFSENQRLKQISAPCVEAAVALQKNKPQDAVTALEVVRPYELGTGPTGSGYDSIYLRGLAYLKLKDGAKAGAEFQRILDHRGVGPRDPEYSLSHLNLGRAYVIQGDSAKARTAYQDFFAAWKDADPDVPVLKTAKAEYDKLK